MNKKIVYGTAKLSNPNYGYGSSYKTNKSSIKSLNNYISNNKRIKSYEVATKYKNSIKNSLKIINKEIHYKIDSIPNNKNKIEKFLNKAISKYLLESNRKKIDIFYIHPHDLKTISNPVTLKILKKNQELKKIKYIGVSLYDLEALKYALKSKIINVIQIPVNVADSFLYSKIPKNSKKIIVARSMYLQGTLINDIKNHSYKKKIENFKKKTKFICKNNKLEYFKTVTSFPFNLKKVDQVIFSSLNKNNLKQSLNSIYKIKKNNFKIIYNDSIKFNKWANPRNW